MDAMAGWDRSMEAPCGCWQAWDCVEKWDCPLEKYFSCSSRASHQLPFAEPASLVTGIRKVAFPNYRDFKMQERNVKGKEHLQHAGMFSEMG